MATASKRPIHIVLWVLQVLLGLMMIASGANKLFGAEADLVKIGMTFIAELGMGFTRFAGACLVAGGLGLILPAATRILPWLTPLAALMLTTYFALAAGYHLQHGESPSITLPIMLVAAFIAYGRFKLAPIAPKSA